MRWDPRADIEEFVDRNTDEIDETINVATNIVTYGLLGYKDGKFGAGVTSRAVDEGVGEMTGRNSARKEMMNNEDRIEAERINRINELQNQRLVNERNDIAASKAAGVKPVTTKSNTGVGTDLAMQATQLLSRDFLGL